MLGYLALSGGNHEIYEMMSALGSYYKTSLSKGDEIIPLRKEIEIVKDYLFILNIPSQNGIELSRIIRETYPHMRIIILTGYGEFEYARESLKIGVSDFLTKPIIAKEIQQSILRVKDQLLIERSKQEEYERLQRQLEKSISYIQEMLLSDSLYERQGLQVPVAKHEAKQPAHDSDIIREMMDYIETHYKDSELTLNIMYNRFHLNPSYLSRIFKQRASALLNISQKSA